MKDRFLRVKDICPQIVPVSVGQLWKMVRDGAFPAPTKITPRITVWPESAVYAWIENHIAVNAKAA